MKPTKLKSNILPHQTQSAALQVKFSDPWQPLETALIMDERHSSPSDQKGELFEMLTVQQMKDYWNALYLRYTRQSGERCKLKGSPLKFFKFISGSAASTQNNVGKRHAIRLSLTAPGFAIAATADDKFAKSKVHGRSNVSQINSY